MFEIKNLTIMVKDRYIVKNLSLTLNKKDKLGIIGEEGNGKSTLLKSILGICEYASITGTINTKNSKVGYLEQSMSNENLNKTVKEFLFESEEDYYNKINDFYKNLEIIKVTDEVLDRKIKTLSGGEKIKIGILKLLINDYDILFLDEPTNDLDIETLLWLESFINKSMLPIVFISHDETLLSKTANMILHLEQIKNKTDCRHTLLKISYDEYVEKRLNRIRKQTKEAGREKREYNKKLEKLIQVMNKVEYEQNTISRSNPHGAKLLKKKMHSLKSQEKKLNETELTQKPDIEENINFFFENASIPKTKKIIDIKLDELKIENKILSKNINLEIIGNEHICIIGKNGVGKSTLLKLIYNELKTRNDIKVGYMPQDYGVILDNYEYVLDFIAPNKNKDTITLSRMYLGNMNITSDEMTSKISSLSNGTKAKLFLIKFVLDKCNVLILDEPTRNVSPLSNPIIRKVLNEFNGTIISISHDRKYIEEVINKIYILTENGLEKTE